MLKYIIFVFSLAVGMLAKGQDTTFFDNDWEEVKSLNQSTYYQVEYKDAIDTNKVLVKTWYNNGQQRSEKNFSDFKNSKEEGISREWYKDGTLKKEIHFKDGKYHGLLQTWWMNGQTKRIDTFANDSLVTGKCMNSDGVETMHYAYEKMAEFPGGVDELMQYIVKEIKYPKKSRRNGIEGRVMLSFIIEKDGGISNIKIVEGVNDEIDAEAFRVVKAMPQWEPGMVDGESVRVSFNLPIRFALR